MSLYRFKIRQNYSTITGGTVQPMVNSATGSQAFTDYLTIYTSKPGQYNSVNNRSTLINDFAIGNVGGFNYIKDGISLTPESYFNLYTSGANTLISSGNTIYSENNYKNITIPIDIKFNIVDYSEDINSFVEDEKQKSINPIIDGEKIKYVSEYYPSIKLKFRFYDKVNNLFDTLNLSQGYELAGFLPEEINIKNNFRKSYFRLYFYDSNNIKNQNLLLSEDLDLFNSYKPEFSLDRIYWLKKDKFFTNNLLNNRRVYMEARFFNAKTGRVHRFINTPTSVDSPLSISTLANQPTWKHSDLLILNPNINNGKYHFRVVNGIGANTTNTITMTEYILIT
jgi:hypothetical protein